MYAQGVRLEVFAQGVRLKVFAQGVRLKVYAQGVHTGVLAQGVWADRKDAKNVIPDSSARAIHGAGRFTLLPKRPAP